MWPVPENRIGRGLLQTDDFMGANWRFELEIHMHLSRPLGLVVRTRVSRPSDPGSKPARVQFLGICLDPLAGKPLQILLTSLLKKYRFGWFLKKSWGGVYDFGTPG